MESIYKHTHIYICKDIQRDENNGFFRDAVAGRIFGVPWLSMMEPRPHTFSINPYMLYVYIYILTIYGRTRILDNR